MTVQDELLREVEAFCRERGIAETTFGKLANKNSDLVERIRSGRVTLRIAQLVREYIAMERSRQAV